MVCRNVLIYFEPEVAAATLARLAGAVAPGGYLLLGPVELPLVGGLDFDWVERAGATLLRRPAQPYSTTATSLTKYSVSPKQLVGTPRCWLYLRLTRFPSESC